MVLYDYTIKYEKNDIRSHCGSETKGVNQANFSEKVTIRGILMLSREKNEENHEIEPIMISLVHIISAQTKWNCFRD